jgi:hypothetical protein
MRRQLHEYALRKSTPADPADALVWVLRMKRVGDRLALRAETLTFRRWAIHKRMGLALVEIAWIEGVLVAVVFAASMTGYADPIPGTSDRVILAIVVAAAFLGPAALVLQWNTDRWWLRAIGADLRADAEIAEKAVKARIVQPVGFVQRLRDWAHGLGDQTGQKSGSSMRRGTRQ